MFRTEFASVALVALILLNPAGARAQERHSDSANSPTLAERFDRFRRNLFGSRDEEPPHEPRRHAVPVADARHHHHSVRQQGLKAHGSVMPQASSRRRNSHTGQQDLRMAEVPRERRSVGESDDADPVYVRSGEPTAAGSDWASTSRRYQPDELSSIPGRDGEQPASASEDLRASPAMRAGGGWSSRSSGPLVERHLPPSDISTSTRQEVPAIDAPQVAEQFTRSTPLVVVQTTGPRRVVLGKPALYEVTATNAGEQPAIDVVVQVDLPPWAEIGTAHPTAGTTAAPDGGNAYFQWTIGDLPAHRREKLLLEVVLQESRSFDLAAWWVSTPSSTQATVHVEEPKLDLRIEGPAEVLCGSKEIYRLTVMNPGSGDAEHVVVHLLPVESEGGPPTSHQIGTVEAGDTRLLEIELAARQGGRLVIGAEATADGGLKAAAATEVTVRRANLEVAVSGPARQYAAAPATFRVLLRNTGDAPAQHVKLACLLPRETEFISASDGGTFDAPQSQVTWSIDPLPAGSEEEFEFRCAAGAAGENRLEAVATADADLRHSHALTTEVMAVADLVLEAADPPGPVALGQDATYEVRVRNRGSKGAEGIGVVAFFSNGIEPVSAEGGPNEISPGTVVFEPIASLPAGRDVVYRIRARANLAGNHRFRVELECQSLGTRLAADEATLFYGDGSGSSLPDDDPRAGTTSPVLPGTAP